MEFYGLFPKYPVNRPLSDSEVRLKLDQKKRLPIEPICQLSVVKVNSTYLESVDKWFAWKGSLSFFMTTILILCASLLSAMIYTMMSRSPDYPSGNNDFNNFLLVCSMTIPVMLFVGWILAKDSFAYTHYPIRFNRRHRMVHIFRIDGTMNSIPWDDIYFTLGYTPQMREWEVRGHIVDKATSQVVETFSLSSGGSLASNEVYVDASNISSEDYVRAHWEFIRRYMEEGPEAILGRVQFCMPVDGRRESISVGVERTFANIASAPIVLYWALWPLCALFSILVFV